MRDDSLFSQARFGDQTIGHNHQLCNLARIRGQPERPLLFRAALKILIKFGGRRSGFTSVQTIGGKALSEANPKCGR